MTRNKKHIYENSEEAKKREAKRKKARQLAEKMMGANYFTNMQEVMLQTAIELSERKE